MSKVFRRTGSLSPGKSVFDLSYEKKFTCDMAELIPVMCDEMVPGDFFKIGNQAVIRFQPLVAPILHEINMYVHYFFVPYRLLWSAKTRELLSESGDWEDFITGGFDGQNADTLPTWAPSDTTVGSLWDYLGFPVGVDPDGAYPIDFPRRAYNFILNEFYLDETLDTALGLDNETIQNRRWEKDYFTSALPWQQRGTSPALPISGTLQAVWPSPSGSTTINMSQFMTGNTPANIDTQTTLNNNTIDASGLTTVDIADLRLAFQVQRWLERNARAGVRYTEFLGAHFGVSPRDDRLQRPEYIGGSKSPIIISEVLQTSETSGTAQGNMAGHGLNVSSAYCGKYHAKEFGLIMGIMSVMPRSAYSQGINRQWLKETKYDFYFPEFANLSEQAILQAEIYASGVDTENQTIFGYQGRFDEMRVKQNMICGDMRSTFDYWHLGRQFSSAPTLNSTFITSTPRKDIFAAPSEDGLIISFANIIKAFRPIPIMSEPGLVDH